MRRIRSAETAGWKASPRLSRGVAVLALAASSCLVTQEAAYEAQDNTPRIGRVSPSELTVRLPSAPDLSCRQPDHFGFKARIADLDLEQRLLWGIYVDGVNIQPQGEFRVASPPSEIREMDEPACVPRIELNGGERRCKLVTLVVSPAIEDVSSRELRFEELTLSERAAMIEWQVLVDGTTDPLASNEHCVVPAPDAGTP